MLLTNVYVFVMDETFYMHETQNVEYSKKKIAENSSRPLQKVATIGSNDLWEAYIQLYIQ